MNIKNPIHRRNLQARITSIPKWKVHDEVKIDILRFIDELELGKVNKGRKISEARRLKYLDLLIIPLEFWAKSVESLEMNDVEDFEKALSSGRIISRLKGRPFMESTKADIRKALKVFLRWRLGRERGNALTDWLDVREPQKTPDYLSEHEIESLYKACRTAEQRFMIAVLFDSGARAEEFHNIRYEDVQLPEGRENYVRLTLKEEYSKTRGRVIALYWKHSVDAVRDYVQERGSQGIRAKDPLITKSYDAGRQWLFRLGKEVSGRPIHYHLFRHSSATFYANKLNRQELCYRYGWTFSSNMPDVYISRTGMANKELDTRFANSEIGELRMKVEAVERENRMLKEIVARMREQQNLIFGQLTEYGNWLRAEKLRSSKSLHDSSCDSPITRY